jgi:hypothetical protein
MSYNVDLVDENDKIVEVVPHSEGGVYVLGGSLYATLNITYNYSQFFHDVLDEKEGLQWLNGKLAKDTMIRLEYAIQKLDGNRSDNYWESTSGNAKHALKILLAWAKQHPYATFKVC